ncbi:MAG: SUMF1/EgtB/PvdO family nonheme iron enzyme [Myxococcales bacterium]|nr:SUMF1/EgtB/PvdO family nonheme iron enzyme [Polyangiaceae bacterium]MDW8248044.1 SUMF1/EgtB/PvdO family nonheme iron enzyme [Myxococcales bacterium]
MLTREILDLGLAAFEQGYLDREELAEALVAATALPRAHNAETFWKGRGLSSEQLDALLINPATLSSTRNKIGDGTGPSIVITSSALRASTQEGTFSHEEQPTRLNIRNPSERFLKRGVLGVGGMGEVVEYEDQLIGRSVAIKRLKAETTNSQRAAAMLEREARITGRLEHPNIVPLYDMGEDPQRGPFYIMRLLSHPTLAQILVRLRKREPDALHNYSLNKLIRCFVQVCRTVDYAHSRGVIHCDLKPANILVGPYGEVLVVDWGFCHILGERRSQRGGTPGFLAPEQLAPEGSPLDPRTDVFALGAVLYDILCLHHAFPILPLQYMLDAVQRGALPFPPPIPPSQRAPDRKISPELDEICLKALSLDPDKRHVSARELADAVDLYLEGTREKERRILRAQELTSQGDTLANNYRELRQSAPERAAEINLLRATIVPWSSPEEKQALWDAEDREEVLQSVARRTFQAAITAYEHALEESPEYAPARLGLARLYWEALQGAQDRRSEGERVYLEGMVNQYDDGSLQRSARTVASLSLEVRGPIQGMSLWLTREIGRRLLPVRELRFQETKIQTQGLEPGSYLVQLDLSGGILQVPLHLRAGAEAFLSLDLSTVGELIPGERLIPAGEALLGGHEASLLGEELRRIHVPTFFLQEFPVTFREYLAFLSDIRTQEPARLEQLLPRTENGEPLWELDAQEFRPVIPKRWGHNEDTFLQLPVVGIDLPCALAFAHWKSEQTGRHYRLPNELEWEKAARGVDGRAYPWGDRFDASFCKMRESRPGVPHPEPPGSFSSDVSPYGIRDMAGGVADWVIPALEGDSGQLSNQGASRGGAWCDWRLDCHVAVRRPYSPQERSERVGFRLARSADEVSASSSSRPSW